MSRDYGRVGSGRRRGSGAWQWLIIGGVLGFGCAAVLALAGLTLGFLAVDLNGTGIAAGSTPTPVVVTATLDASVPTPTPVVVTATPDIEATVSAAETAASVSEMVPPTATLQPTDAPVEAAPTDAPAAQPTTADAAAPTPAPDLGATAPIADGAVPPQLAAVMSPMVDVPAGTFTMGTTFEEVAAAVRLCEQLDGACQTSYGEDSIPERQVTLDAYRIERTEVSYEQYVAFLNYLQTTGRSHSNGCGTTVPRPCVNVREEDSASNISFDSANYSVVIASQLELPVVNVTWYGADAYCRAIGRRLPTEAEWERAARGPSNFLYPWGNDWNPDNAKTNRSTDETAAPVPVESYLAGASGFGTLNMAGNVAEWVSDWYVASFYRDSPNAVNPTGPLSGADKVVRGGSWPDQPFFARAVHRQHWPPDNDYVNVGFRCAADAVTLVPDAGTNDAGSTNSFPTPASGTVDPMDLGTLGDEDSGTDDTAPALPTPIPTADPAIATLTP